MFEEIFFPRTVERYRAAPFVEQRERYLIHLRKTGARRPTLRKCANDQLSLVRLLNLKEGGGARLSQIEVVTAIWSQPRARRCDRPASPKARTRFVNRAVRWLRFLGWLDETEKGRHSYGAEVDAYEAWMRSDRGLSEETIGGYRAAADEFFDWLAAADIPLASVRIGDIDNAINDKKARGTCDRRAMHDYAQRLRAFFRFAEARSWCTPRVAAGIMPPRFMRDEAVPKGLQREDVLRLLATARGSRPADRETERSCFCSSRMGSEPARLRACNWTISTGRMRYSGSAAQSPAGRTPTPYREGSDKPSSPTYVTFAHRGPGAASSSRCPRRSGH
jgi:hypothetical protein